MYYKNSKQYRYKKYDYSSDGFYFVTICTGSRKMFLGKFEGENLTLSKLGKIVNECWQEISLHFENSLIDYYVVMPNHFHGIVQIKNKELQKQNRAVPCFYDDNYHGDDSDNLDLERRRRALPCDVGEKKNFSKFGQVVPRSLSTIIGSFKSAVSRRINMNYHHLNFSWQSRFYDRIIRNDEELNKIRQYITNNPFKWHLDRNNPANIKRTGHCPVPTDEFYEI
jgi:putative transposase